MKRIGVVAALVAGLVLALAGTAYAGPGAGGTGGNDGQVTGSGTIITAGGGGNGRGEGQGGIGVADANTGATIFAAGGGATHAREPDSRDAWGGRCTYAPDTTYECVGNQN